MNTKLIARTFLAAAILIAAHTLISAQGVSMGAQSSEDVIVRWNRVLTETVRIPGMHPATVMQVRSFAMMHGAMFDAVNSIDGTHTALLVDVPGYKNASIEAAAAQAAHDVLIGLYPTRASVFDTELATSLAGIDANRAMQ